MKAFVSGQIGEKMHIRECFKKLADAGYSISHDWTRTDDLQDKRNQHTEAGRRAKADIDGVLDCDIYVLISDNRKAGKGMYVELGAALARREITGRPEVFVVGPMNHLSIFYLHPLVRHASSVDAMIDLATGRLSISR